MDEEWMPIPGFGGHYEASNRGRIRVKDRTVSKRHRMGAMITQFYRGRVLNPHKSDKLGHMSVHIGVDGRCFGVGVHRLVLLAFVGPCPPGMEACHGNGDAGDNRLENLRWDTHFNNNQDRKALGHYAVGEKHHMAKLTSDQAMAIRTRAVTKRQAMRDYGISNSQHHRIMKGESWKHLDERLKEQE